MTTNQKQTVTYLRMLGSPSLQLETSIEVPHLPSKAYALISILIIKFRGSAQRNTLAAELWEEADDSQALNNLRQLLQRIRQIEGATGIKLVETNNTTISYNENCVRSDLVELLTLNVAEIPAQTEAMFSLYGGELLAGISLPGYELQEWFRFARASMQDRFISIALANAQKIDSEDYGLVLRRLLVEMPYEDRVCRALMTHLAENRDTAGARQVYNSFLKGADTNLQPEPETTELYNVIVQGREQTQLPLNYNSVDTTKSASVAELSLRSEVNSVATQKHATNIPRLMLLNPTYSKSLISRRQASVATSFVEDITFDLCRLRTIETIAPYSARQIMADDPLERARELNVDYFVQFRISPVSFDQKAYGPDVRISLMLIQTITNKLIWGEEYTFTFGVENEHFRTLAASIAHAIIEKVGYAAINAYQSKDITSAYTYFLLGQEQMRALNLPNLRRARKLFRMATNKSPLFTPAISAISRTLTLEWVLLAQKDNELLLSAQKTAQTAVDIDPYDGNGYREIGRSSLYLSDFDKALEYGLAAEHHLPRHADVLADLADTFVHSSRLVEAQNRIELAIRLNPLPPDEYYWISGGIEFFSGNYLRALSQLEKMRNQDNAYRLMAASAAMAGNLQAAYEFRSLSLSVYPDFRLDEWLSILPQRNTEHLSVYASALRKAGFK